jgi:UDP-3-O-[3-hydroxymyristoyl] glucosamine N-acyltransferase
MAHVLHYFDQRDKLRSFPDGISPLSWIDPTAQLGSGVTIAPFTTIGPHVHIGDNAVIGPHCIIEGGSKIGQHCYIEGHIFIGRQCEVGDYCRIKPFASIGSDGFGYAPTPQGALKIPQIGNVVLENYVDVGSGTCIDRATMSTTRIGFGTKIDNLVHIAHNCEVGRYCFVTACFAMAGSSKLGDFFMTGGATAVGDHVTITEKVTLAGASVVTSNIDKSGAYGGHPVQPMQDFLRTRSIMTQLPEMRKQLQRIVKHLGLQDQPPKA